jgi:DNA-binding transcriptional ArsR family regulator
VKVDMKNGYRTDGTSNGVEEEIYERQVSICRAFANPTRLRMLDLVAKHSRRGSELQQTLGISTANLSQHLAVLKAAGVVVTRRDGKQICCSLAMPEVKQACKLIRNVLRAQVRNGRKLVV